MKKQPDVNIPHEGIDPQAYRIVQTLQNAGFETYLVGGCVRDLLAGFEPKDFDIATSALPTQVKRKVSNSYVIGRRFKLVLAKRGDQQFEIATFRKNAPDEVEVNADGEADEIQGDNHFGTSAEDAQRRDFTINALFYDPVAKKIIDHCEGLRDIRNVTLRMIGDPKERLQEDPIRILRAVRLSQKLKFMIEPELRSCLISEAPLLATSVLPRRREEWLKFLKLPFPTVAFAEMKDLGILKSVLPSLDRIYDHSETMEIFEYYLKRFLNSFLLENNSTELFTALVLAYAMALTQENWGEIVKLEENEVFQKFIREELGVHKAEMITFQKSIEFVGSLQNISLFERRGPRRQEAFLGHDVFEIALRIGEASHQLSSEVLHFWEAQLAIRLRQNDNRSSAMDPKGKILS